MLVPLHRYPISTMSTDDETPVSNTAKPGQPSIQDPQAQELIQQLVGAIASSVKDTLGDAIAEHMPKKRKVDVEKQPKVSARAFKLTSCCS